MGFYSAIKATFKGKKTKKDIFRKCPICSKQSFLQCTDMVVGVSIYDISELVGIDTGVCENCGAMAQGNIYLEGLDVDALVNCAEFNIRAYITAWELVLTNYSLQGGCNNKGFDFADIYPKIEKADPFLFKKAKFEDFLPRCIGYYNRLPTEDQEKCSNLLAILYNSEV